MQSPNKKFLQSIHINCGVTVSMSGVRSMIYRCPRCNKYCGWTSRTKRPKKLIDTNCGSCQFRVRFTPLRADKWSKTYGSEGRGRKSTVKSYIILTKWYSQHEVHSLASNLNYQESESRLEWMENQELSDFSRWGIVPPRFSNYSINNSSWKFIDLDDVENKK